MAVLYTTDLLLTLKKKKDYCNVPFVHQRSQSTELLCSFLLYSLPIFPINNLPTVVRAWFC